MVEYQVSRAAQQDIRHIGRYSQDAWGKAQRRRYLSNMEQHFRLLAQSPLLASERTEFDPPVRIFPFEQHLIVYVMIEMGILILRVLHKNMDIPGHLQR